MNKGVTLAFFLLVGILVGLATNHPAYGVGSGLALGLVSFVLLPEKKKKGSRSKTEAKA